MKTNKRGISLIVLVITIIVMIILATAIVLSLSSNDIVDSAKDATNASDFANAKQLVMVAEAEWEMEPEPGFSSFKDYAESKLIAAGFKVNGGTGTIEVSENAEVHVYPTIPEGFVASQIKGEDKVATGLVIYQTTTPVTATTDAEIETARRTYNQYVWIPVPNIEEFERIEWNQGNKISDTQSYNLNDAIEAVAYSAMKESVEKYGGFYIGRYEAGKEGTDTLVSKKNVTVWQEINWKNSKSKCETLSSDTVVGHLIYGEEWDAAISFISKTDADYPTNSGGKGNYLENHQGKVQPSGSSDDYAVNNIYDMAGNVWEWTMEYYSTNERVVRGGHANEYSDYYTASSRYHNDIFAGYSARGFRSSIYLK